jgi:hypothetical protein
MPGVVGRAQMKRAQVMSWLCWSFLFSGGLGGLAGCATYQNKVSVARTAMTQNHPEEAVKDLEPLALKSSDDQLVYLLDYATALQDAGRFKDSTVAFNRAEKIADVQDYHSLSRVASSLLLSEEMVQYKGDDYEKVLINAVNSVNYLELGQLDDALVEVRKLNQKLYKFKTEAKRNYSANPYAYYLSAIIWEADHKWDDAYIAYKDTYALIPDYAPLHEDLIRAAMRAGRSDDIEEWKSKFPEVKIKPEWRDSTSGQIVLVYQQGWGPRKIPRPEAPRFPTLTPTYSNTARATVYVDGEAKAETNRIFSVQQEAIKTLNDDYARLVASRVAGVAVKAVVANQIAQKNQALGALAWLAMNAVDRADLRQWSTLPESFQIARVTLKPGHYKVRVQGLDGFGHETNEHMDEKEVTVRAGQKVFLAWRSFH